MGLTAKELGIITSAGAVSFCPPKSPHGLLGPPNLLLSASDPFVGDKLARTWSHLPVLHLVPLSTA